MQWQFLVVYLKLQLNTWCIFSLFLSLLSIKTVFVAFSAVPYLYFNLILLFGIFSLLFFVLSYHLLSLLPLTLQYVVAEDTMLHAVFSLLACLHKLFYLLKVFALGLFTRSCHICSLLFVIILPLILTACLCALLVSLMFVLVFR